MLSCILAVGSVAWVGYRVDQDEEAPWPGMIWCTKVSPSASDPTMHGNTFNMMRLRQNGRHFTGNILKCICLNENVWIPFKISLKFVLKFLINNIPALVQIMAWHRPGDKPLSQPKMVSILYICITHLQWVNHCCAEFILRTTKLYVYLLSFFNNQLPKVVEILPLVWQGSVSLPWSISWLLMPWLHK